MGDRSKDLRTRKLAERVLKDRGTLPLAVLLEVVVSVGRLRALAQELALSPKGFRIDSAPARVLAPLLAERTDPSEMEQVVDLLLVPLARDGKGSATSGGKDAAADEHAVAEQSALEQAAIDRAAASRFKDQELQRLRDELERARETALRATEREVALRRAADRDAEELQARRADLERRSKQIAPTAAAAPEGASRERELERRLHDAEQEIEARTAADEALRRQLAAERTNVRELEDEVKELEALLPRGRRRKVPPPPPPEPARVRVPHFLPSFYKSLVGKDRKSVERAVQAVLLFCTEGHAYPGLEVKKLGGQDTWSLRASLGLRVYWKERDDGDIDVLELADREEQHTTLRGLKDR